MGTVEDVIARALTKRSHNIGSPVIWSEHNEMILNISHALREAGMLREWEPIATCPYDEICLMLLEDGNIIQDFMYDCGPDWLAERGVTHWMPLPPPPQKDD